MLKKIITITLLVGLTGILIWGGVNRTLAKTGENGSSTANSKGHGAGGKGSETHAGSENADCDDTADKIQSQDGNFGPGNEPNSSQGENSRGRGNGRGQGNGFEPLAEAEIEALHLALQDEYHALAVYQAVIADFGDASPFVEIAESEIRHIDALLKQFEKHDLNPPENTWLGNVPGFESLQAACQAGVEAEIANVALYEQLFSMTDDPGLIQVFTNLSRASQESHLPEFQSCQ